ncbi:transmembrane protein 272 isoform X3 [Diabrotica virgifera virgifera]|uniref:Uncharacterized protein LOC114335705 isoform X3 n=1 Tax=Diabrotica virgifera virgifera TaxID=50390 RepID=A0A6P7FYZ5_DIAVI|nr:transmembrane protein 272 isoform X3 [Diabrotica virgifera virgifera]
MEHHPQQSTDSSAAQHQPLNNPPATGSSNAHTPAQTQKARIAKIKQKLLPGVKITLLLSLIIYLAMLIIGILGVHHCPVEENIPLFLIATGAIGLITKITTYMREQIMRHFQVGYVESSLYTIEMVFLILGAYWVYKEYPPKYDPIFGRAYCQKTAYMMAFVYITFIFGFALVVVAGFIFFLCCICCLAGCSLKSDDEEQPQGGAA